MKRPFYKKPVFQKYVYDFCSYFYGAIIASLLQDAELKNNISSFFCGYILYLLLLQRISRYNDYIYRKIILIVTSFIISLIPSFLLGNGVLEVCVFSAVVMPLLILPRLIFYYVGSNKYGVISNIISTRKPVLVVGGAGYIGSNVVRYLLKQDYSVRVLDTLMFGDESLKEFQQNSRLEIIVGDVTDVEKLTLALKDVYAVIHLGGLVGDPACSVDSKLTRQLNVYATRMLMQSSESMGVKRFIFASSCSVYGVNDSEVDETAELHPVSLYANTKIDSEAELLPRSSQEFAVTSLRFATVFGHSPRPRFDLVVNLFTALAMAGKTLNVIGSDQWRPFVHVKDLARAVVMTLNSPIESVEGQIFNVGDKSLNATILDVAKTVQSVANEKGVSCQIEIMDELQGDKRNYFVNFDKIKEALGFECTISLEDGIKEMADYHIAGSYDDYTNVVYNNYETTKVLADQYFVSNECKNIYTPLSDC